MSTVLHAWVSFPLRLPDCIAPLREETETVVSEAGWTEYALGKTCELNSFLRVAEAYGAQFLYVHVLVNVPAAI